jgi:hypothetical protein
MRLNFGSNMNPGFVTFRLVVSLLRDSAHQQSGIAQLLCTNLSSALSDNLTEDSAEQVVLRG